MDAIVQQDNDRADGGQQWGKHWPAAQQIIINISNIDKSFSNYNVINTPFILKCVNAPHPVFHSLLATVA